MQKSIDIALARAVSAVINEQVTKLRSAIASETERHLSAIADLNVKLDALSRLPGPAGIDGKDGRDGIDGKDGAPGIDGKDGAPGRDGIDGKDGSSVDPEAIQADIYKAVTTQVNAKTVVLHEFLEKELERVVAALPIPENGKDGRDGVDGKEGPPGKDGKDGRDGINGKDGASVYITDILPEILAIGEKHLSALDSRIGDEVQRAISVLPAPSDGKDGRDGIDGQPGKDGRDGTDGKDGRDGVDGKDGASIDPEVVRDQIHKEVATRVDHQSSVLTDWLNDELQKAIAAIPVPTNGKDGRDGVDGKEGPPGKDGRDGASGKDGRDGVDGKEGPPGKDGRNGVDGKSVSLEELEAGFLPKCRDWTKDYVHEAIQQQLADAIGAIPIPKDGLDGKNGRDGKDGLDGVDGKDGKDGRDGLDGRSVSPEEVFEVASPKLEQFCSSSLDAWRIDADGAVKEYLAAIPEPRNGRDGVDGKDGRDGIDGKSVTTEDIISALDAEIENRVLKALLSLETRVVDTMQRAIEKIPAPKDGRDGRDGLGFENFHADFDGHRTLTFVFEREDQRKDFQFILPYPLEVGVFKTANIPYQRGDVVSYDGSLWIAQRETSVSPKTDDSWRLCVKKGRDGKDGKNGEKGDRGPEGPRGKDLTQRDFEGRRF